VSPRHDQLIQVNKAVKKGQLEKGWRRRRRGGKRKKRLAKIKTKF
jgi:hypothetical protein